MRWVLWLVVALMTMHHLAMTAMPLAVASPMPMAQASIAHPQPCSATAVQQAPEPCLESCSILHATTLSRAAATAPSPTASAGHTIDPGRSARLFVGTPPSGPPLDAGCRPPSVLQVLRI